MDANNLCETMTRNGDSLSYPYWSTQQLLWNGERVVCSAPQREPVVMWVNELSHDEE